MTDLINAATRVSNWGPVVARTRISPDIDFAFASLQAAVLLGTNEELLQSTSRDILDHRETLEPKCSPVIWEAISADLERLRATIQSIEGEKS